MSTFAKKGCNAVMITVCYPSGRPVKYCAKYPVYSKEALDTFLQAFLRAKTNRILRFDAYIWRNRKGIHELWENTTEEIALDIL